MNEVVGEISQPWNYIKNTFKKISNILTFRRTAIKITILKCTNFSQRRNLKRTTEKSVSLNDLDRIAIYG